MTPTQKDFKRQIKKLERQGKIPDNYRPRRQRVTFKHKVSIISIIFLLWNSYAIYSWIAPNIKRYINPDTAVSTNNINDVNPVLGNNGTVYNDAAIIYLDKIREINIKISYISSKYLDYYLNDTVYLFEDIHEDLNELNGLNDDLISCGFIDDDLTTVYFELINITEEILFNLSKPYEENVHLVERYNINGSLVLDATIDFLDSHGIKYELKDNTIVYYYNK